MLRSNRPWHRSLIKAGARLLMGGSRAHVQDWFPGLSIVHDGETGRGQVSYRRRRVAPLCGGSAICERSGDAVYIIGSGPSVRGCDLTRLEDESAILLNGAISLIGAPIGRPLAIAIEDERFIWRHFDLVTEKVAADALCLLSVPALRAICEIDRAFLADKRVILIDDIRKPYGARRRSGDVLRRLDFVRFDDAGEAGFSLRPDRGVFQGGSVATSALQFALACRPASIGLIGIDISNADGPRFYETGKDIAFSGVARAEARIVSHFVLAKAIAAEQGTALVNHSPVSALLQAGFGYDARFAIGESNAAAGRSMA